ncbi:hypothetical protein [Salinicola avicenniae]|uniref:hypothetical protein n=1 Tax=Salinicola avicenniae TaxID=2916836 RepID=UPI00207372FD|nr:MULTISPECIES: hypothetical protein [unclassified Salinicola]
MPVRRWIWGVWLLVLLCYFVPYGLLGQVHAWYGSFLFWSVVGILVIVANVLITRDFGERDFGEMPDDRNGEEEA